MGQQMILRSRRLSRDELYALVWKTPMIKLGAEFGISGNGLAKICDRLNVPYPPRGYWAKKAAGKQVATSKLPPSRSDIPKWANIHPTPPKPQIVPETSSSAKAASAIAEKISVPETTDNLHPKVMAWIAEHNRDQKERARENKRSKRDIWSWASPLIADLTERDLYRFRATSAIFTAVEQAGGRISEARITGKVTFSVCEQDVECTIAEKMLKRFGQLGEEADKWTAYPRLHQTGLSPSGFLRIAINTHLGLGLLQWVEARDKKIGDLLPSIVGAIIGAGPILVRREQERQEEERRRREEEARRWELRRQREIDEQRWGKFREQAILWEEHARIKAFIAELERRLAIEGDVVVRERPITEWISWAKEKTEALNPFRQGARGFFERITF